MNGKQYSIWSSHYDPEYKELEILHKHSVDFSEKNVLEIGCGTGRFTRRIIDACSSIKAVDPDEQAIKVIRQNIQNPKLEVIQGTFEDIEYTKNFYDYVVFSWSMYLIEDKLGNLNLAFDALKPNGKLIVLQANSGEYESEVAKMYSSYDSLKAYESAYGILEEYIRSIFGNVTTDILETYFTFENIEQTIQNSLFFIVDEEGEEPSPEKIQTFKNRLGRYQRPNGEVVMSDIVSVYIATKRG